jgi:hypothetical protein
MTGILYGCVSPPPPYSRKLFKVEVFNQAQQSGLSQDIKFELSIYQQIHSWDCNSLKLMKKFPAICGTQRFITMFTRALFFPCPDPNQSISYPSVTLFV